MTKTYVVYSARLIDEGDALPMVRHLTMKILADTRHAAFEVACRAMPSTLAADEVWIAPESSVSHKLPLCRDILLDEHDHFVRTTPGISLRLCREGTPIRSKLAQSKVARARQAYFTSMEASRVGRQFGRSHHIGADGIRQAAVAYQKALNEVNA